MKYQAPFGSVDPNASYVDKSVVGAIAGSKVPAKAIEHPQREIAAVISDAGITPDDTQLDQLLRALKRGNKTIAVYTASGNFTVPAKVTRVKATVVGGGGGSGGTGTVPGQVGGAGGAGGFSIGYFDVTPGDVIAVTVGAGGSAVTGAVDGNAGGTSSFGSLCSATGGGAGTNAGGSGAGAGGAGGVGSGGAVNGQGGFGSDGQVGSTAWPAQGGASCLGGGSRGGSGGGGGSATGARGSGGGNIYATASATGRPGMPGIVIIEY